MDQEKWELWKKGKLMMEGERVNCKLRKGLIVDQGKDK